MLKERHPEDEKAIKMIEQVMNTADTTPQKGLRDEAWQLIDRATFDLLAELRKNQTLAEYVDDQIYYGIKTGYNEAFVIAHKKAQ